MDQIDGERLLTKPDEIAVREQLPHPGAEVEAESDEREAERGGGAREVRVLGEDGHEHVVLDAGPRHPLGFVFGERRKEEADRDEAKGKSAAELFPCREKREGALVILEVAEKGAPESLVPESS